MSQNIGSLLHHEWSSTGPHCVNVVTVTAKYFKMRFTGAIDFEIHETSNVTNVDQNQNHLPHPLAFRQPCHG